MHRISHYNDIIWLENAIKFRFKYLNSNMIHVLVEKHSLQNLP